MRMLRRVMLLAATLAIAACGDVMGPDVETAEHVGVIPSAAYDPCVVAGMCTLDPIEVDGCSDGGCWCDDWWCYDYDDPAYDPHYDPNDDEGGKGGSGGGGSTAPPPYDDWEDLCREEFEPGCKHRFGDDITAAETNTIRAAIDLIRANGCDQVASLLAIKFNADDLGLWDARVERSGGVLYGRKDPVTGNILIWTGYNRRTGDNVNWVRTMAHEALHIITGLGSEGESQIRAQADQCSAPG
jgi:hypothetical protein